MRAGEVAAPSLPGVIWEESRAHLAEPLHPAESECLQRAVAQRREESATVRGRAQRALGRTRQTMVRGVRGEPSRPEGAVGSMTHTDGYCAAAVALRTQIRSLGIDAEPHAPLPDGVLVLDAEDAEPATSTSGSGRTTPSGSS